MPSKTQTFNNRQHMNASTYEIFHYRDTYLHEVGLHHHDFYEIYYFVSGNVDYGIDSRIYHMTPGDILLISPNELHQPMFSGELQNYERLVLWIDKSYLEQFSSIGLDLTRCFVNARQNHANLLRPEVSVRQTLFTLMERIMREREEGEFGNTTFCDCCVIQALIMLNRVASRSIAQPVPPDKSGILVSEVLGYINDHYGEELTLDFLANKFFISKYHLSREFGRLVGTSVHRYIIQKRLVVAKQLLGEGVPSSEVYQHCGFGDYSNFYRAFKAEYEISPREYVNRLKQNSAQERVWMLQQGRAAAENS